MNSKFYGCLKLPAFIFSYPFTVLLVVRLYSLICVLSILFICYRASDRIGREAALIAIADLLALLFVLISLWFTVQKFFYVKLDAALTLISLVFVVGGLVSACSIVQSPETNHAFYIILCHFYLVSSQTFSVGWSLLCTRNAVSRLFILDWGKSVTQTELQQLDGDF